MFVDLCYRYTSNSTIAVYSLCDITLVVVPAYLLSNVQLKRNRKIAIVFLGSGSLVPTLFEIITVSLVISADSTIYQDSTAHFNTLVHIAVSLTGIPDNFAPDSCIYFAGHFSPYFCQHSRCRGCDICTHRAASASKSYHQPTHWFQHVQHRTYQNLDIS